jgi:anti-sigma regulatory factor (Ser/Thr protein kinase)
LATNALLHARTGLTVNLIEGDTTLRVEVVDTGDLPVAHRKYAEDRDAESGRGLQLVAVLASDYGIDINADQAGVTAWFEVGPADDAAVEIRDDVTA